MLRAACDHVLHVGAAVLVGRRADGDELQRAVRDGASTSVVNCSRPAAALRRTIASRPGSWIGTPPPFRIVDLARVDVEAQHVVADLGQAGAGDEADVARADHRDLHARELRIDALIAASAATGSAACVIGRPTTR